MDRFATRHAGPAPRRGTPLFAKAAFAFAAVAMASVAGRPAITEFRSCRLDPRTGIGQHHQRTRRLPAPTTRSTTASARARPRNASVMTYPSRPVTRSLRADFDAEFNHIESLLIGKLRDGSGASSSAGAVMPKSRRCRCRGRGRPKPICQQAARTIRRRRRRRIAAPRSRSWPIWCRCVSRWRR